MRSIRLFFLLLLLLWPTQHLLAWGKTGHRVIAQVAYDNLTPRARRQVDRILGKHGIVYYSNWADEIKSDTIYPDSYDWHYQDFDPGLSDSALVACLTHYPQEGGNLFRAMDSLVALLHNDPSNADALRFVVHLMGDRFCPMHTAHLDDLGGNRVFLQWFKQPYNLHRIWDDGLIEASRYSYSEYAEYLQDHFADQAKAIRQMTDADLLRHNYDLTNEIYDYYADWDGNCWHYLYHFTPKMEWQLYASGIRLAMLLNDIYG